MPIDLSLAEKLELSEKVLSLHPDLEMVVFAGMQARQVGLRYPIKSHEDLKILFGPEGNTTQSYKEHSVSYSQMLEFFPPKFFPIETEDQFLQRVLIVLQRETLSQKKQLDVPSDKLTVFFDPSFASGIPGAIKVD